MTKTDALRILKSLSLSPNKKLGQNFLIDENNVRKIVEAAVVSPSERIVEIGPGLGALTGFLAPACRDLTCIEIDAGYAAYLAGHFEPQQNVHILHEDFLKMESYPCCDAVVSNLPYYCASEILFTVAQKMAPLRICAMMQKEMAERIIAKAGTDSYGAMTVSLSYYYQAKMLFNVPPTAFFPQPDVISTVILFNRVDRSDLSCDQMNLFHSLVKSAFWGRRKTIVKALSSSPHLDIAKTLIRDSLDASGIAAEARGETLTLDEYIRLTKMIYERTLNDAITAKPD
jgi:16S rRNA (adenine1518-N6/adenine1519-N6)-dimethyltransferase